MAKRSARRKIAKGGKPKKITTKKARKPTKVVKSSTTRRKNPARRIARRSKPRGRDIATTPVVVAAPSHSPEAPTPAPDTRNAWKNQQAAYDAHLRSQQHAPLDQRALARAHSGQHWAARRG